MKVVLFCGGLGMRLREYSESIPKPMVPIGPRPVLWHLMKYYAHHGHKDFIICLGHGAGVIKNYFLNYNECESNDFVLEKGGEELKLVTSDIQDWRITFVDTGLHANIGQRLMAVAKYVENEEMFLANYSDGLTDLPLPKMIDEFSRDQHLTGMFACVRPRQSFHLVALDDTQLVTSIEEMTRSGLYVNGGFFIFRGNIMRSIERGEELVHEPFNRLIKGKKLKGYPYHGFWMAMDTFKDKQNLDDLYGRGLAPWEVWKQRPGLGESMGK